MIRNDFASLEGFMSTSTPAGDSARDQLLRQFKSNLANAGSTPTAAASAGQAL